MSEPISLSALIRETAQRVGSNGPAVADAILASAFPETVAAAHREGVKSIFRSGMVEQVTKVLKGLRIDPSQGDFGDYDQQFAHHVAPLQSNTYYVPSVAAQVSVADLIRTPVHLNEARIFMRKKGDECIAEAIRLDALYEAVVGAA